MLARKQEERESIQQDVNFVQPDLEEKKEPLVWLILDEAHEFLPNQGETVATRPLVTILREGRQPGISLILATQQPGKIHGDVMTQSDVVIAHRVTANFDIQALGTLMQSAKAWTNSSTTFRECRGRLSCSTTATRRCIRCACGPGSAGTEEEAQAR